MAFCHSKIWCSFCTTPARLWRLNNIHIFQKKNIYIYNDELLFAMKFTHRERESVCVCVYKHPHTHEGTNFLIFWTQLSVLFRMFLQTLILHSSHLSESTLWEIVLICLFFTHVFCN